MTTLARPSPTAPDTALARVVEAVRMLPALGAPDVEDRYNTHSLTASWLSPKPETTQRTYYAALSSWLSFCDSTGLDPMQARRADVDAWRATMSVIRGGEKQTPSANTINTRLAAVDAWYSYLISNEVTDRNPADAVDRSRVPDMSPYPALRSPELTAFLAYVDARADRLGTETALREAALIRLMSYTGLRTSAALDARFERITFESGHTVLWYTKKGGSVSFVPLPPPVLASLWRYVDTRAAREQVTREALRGPIFVSTPQPPRHEGGNALKQRDLQRILRRLAREAGLDCAATITPHSLRRTAGTVALAEGATLEQVQDLLGHANPTTTRKKYDATRHLLDSSPVFTIAGAVAQNAARQEHTS